MKQRTCLPVWSAALVAIACSVARAGLKPPRHLECEYQPGPLGIDTARPRLSWWLDDDDRGASQSAYQILVAGSLKSLAANRGDLWDSGKVDGSRSSLVPYGGSTLVSRQSCFWKVRVWDGHGGVSPYSRPARWEMGLLSARDWRARWVGGSAETGPKLPRGWRHGSWIWGPTGGSGDRQTFLWREFRLSSAGVKSATLIGTADNRFEVYVNGALVGKGEAWDHEYRFDVASKLVPGWNRLAVAARNEGGPCGVRFTLRVTLKRGDPVWVVTDGQWVASPRETPGWRKVGGSRGGWNQAHVIGRYGCAPWGRAPAGSHRTHLRSVLMRKEFQVVKPVVRARVYVCGLGVYELRLNGRKVGRDLLTPGWTQFHKRLQYQTYEVTRLLRPGRNAVGVVLGNGWWHGRIGGEGTQRGRDSLRLLLQLEIDYAGGGRKLVVTDPSWRCHASPIVADDLYDGETYDARLQLPGWDCAGFVDKDWTPVELVDERGRVLVAQAKETIRARQELPPVKVTEPKPGVYVFDFGQNLTGWCQLKVRADAGTRLQLRHAEVLEPDGNIHTANLRSAKATDVYLARGGGIEVWAPRFTYHGFRYVELTGYPGRPTKDVLTARMVCSAAPRIGSFKCSNDLVNKIQHSIEWGQRSNMYSVPTDCPQRDERLGWTGDTQMFANTACWNLHMARFFSKWLADIRDCQRPDGAVQDVNPTNGAGVASPAWGDACVIVPYQVWRHYGDTRILEDNWRCMTRWVDFLTKHSRGHLYTAKHNYGDWIAIVPSPKAPIASAYYFYDCKLLAEMARALGNEADARKYSSLAEAIRKAFNARYFNTRTNEYPGGTQTANVIPLFFGLVPPGRAAAVAGNVAADLAKRGNHLTTGFLGTGYLNPVLTRTGYHDLAWKLAGQRTYPSWGYMVDHGATTIWELWNSDKAGPGMNSRNHFCLGAVGEWFYEALGGIAPRTAGFKRFVIHPRPAGGLRWVKARVQSPYGWIVSQWRREKNVLRLDVRVPPNTSAEIALPTLGRSGVRIEEGGRLLFACGLSAGSIPGIHSGRVRQDAVVFAAGAGRYHFVVRGVPPCPGPPD